MISSSRDNATMIPSARDATMLPSARDANSSFHPPEWAVAPNRATSEARFEVYKQSQLTQTYMIGTKSVYIFGRDESSEFVLKNPSISRHHAAIIHDSIGGIYIVDLMSRHGTFVGKRKLPPHDPTLLHEKEIVRFGQSNRQYILSHVDPDGKSVFVKKSWPKVKLKAPRFPAKLPVLRRNGNRYSPSIYKLVNSICSGGCLGKSSSSIDLVKTVHSITDEESKELICALVDKIKVKFDLHASQVQLSALQAIGTLIKQKVGLNIITEHIGVIALLSQSRNDNNLRSEARQVLNSLAIAHLDISPKQNNEEIEKDSIEHDEGSDKSNNGGNRETKLSTEGNVTAEEENVLKEESGRRQYQNINIEDPKQKTDVQNNENLNKRNEYLYKRNDNQYNSKENLYQKNQFQTNEIRNQNRRIEEQQQSHFSEEQYIVKSYQSLSPSPEDELSPVEENPLPPLPCDQSHVVKPMSGSGFSFISSYSSVESPLATENQNQESAFSFIRDDTVESSEEAVESPEEEIGFPDGFLCNEKVLSQAQFESFWAGAKETIEWSGPLLELPEVVELTSLFESHGISCLASGTVAGVTKYFFYAEQASNGTIFMAEVDVTSVANHISVSFKWREMDLLYDNSHTIFIDICKALLQRLCKAPEEEVASEEELESEEVASEEELSQEYDFESMLKEEPHLNPGDFEKLWTTSPSIGQWEATLVDLPEKGEIKKLLVQIRLSCLASGIIQDLVKFYFYAESISTDTLFMIEIAVQQSSKSISIDIKAALEICEVQEDTLQIGTMILNLVQSQLDEYL